MSDIDHVSQILCGMQIGSEEIPRNKKQESADLVASFPDCKVLIEVKDKVDSHEYTNIRNEKLEAGEIHHTVMGLSDGEIALEKIKKAASQLNSSANKIVHDFRLIWFTATGLRAQEEYCRFIETLYGTMRVVDLESSFTREVYFYRGSGFMAYKDALDGAVVECFSDLESVITLCINPLSASYEQFRSSSVCTKIKNSLLDPNISESSGKAFILNDDMHSLEDDEKLSFLQEKYATSPLMTFPMDYHHIMAPIITS